MFHFCPACGSRLRNPRVFVLQTPVLSGPAAFLCEALSSCPACLGMLQLQAQSWWLCCSVRPEQGSRGESGVLNKLKACRECCSFPGLFRTCPHRLYNLFYAGEAQLWFVFLQRSLGFVARQKQNQLKTDQGKKLMHYQTLL